MTAEVQSLPQLHIIDKLRQIPLVHYACNTSAGVYNRVKESNSMINWTLESAEGAISLAMHVVAPVANKLPIQVIDKKLCQGVDILERNVPAVKETPSQMYDSAKVYVANSTPVECVQSFTNKSWEKANVVLSSTSVGNMAMIGLDTTSNLADRVIDYYLPGEGNDNIHPHPSTECNDKVLHAVHTVGAISSKVGRRVYRSLSNRNKAKPEKTPTQPHTSPATSESDTGSENEE